MEDVIGKEEAAKFVNAADFDPHSADKRAFDDAITRAVYFLHELLRDVQDHPDSYIRAKQAAAPRLPTRPQIRYAAFVSYSHLDAEVATTLHDAVIGAGHQCFMAEKSLEPGEFFDEAIRDALHGSQQVWIIVSPRSITSEWVAREAWAAWALRKHVVPLLFRVEPKELPEYVSRRHAIDFHKYQKLVAALTAARSK